MAAPGLLSIASQIGAIAYLARRHGVEETFSFQTMLSLWAWTFVLAFGMDRGARRFAASQDGLGAYARRWRARLWAGAALGGACGAVMGASWAGGALAWGAYGAGVAACALGYAGREWMYARGDVDGANRRLTGAFAAAMAAMAALAWADAPFGWVALAWFAPHVAIWMRASSELGLFRARPLPGEAAPEERSAEPAYGFQALGHVAMGTLDLLVAKAALADVPLAFRYVIYSRVVAAAFMISVNFAAAFVRGAVLSSGGAWRAVFARCFAVHAFFALGASGFLALAGPAFTRAWLGGAGLPISGFEAACLAAGGAARAACEAGMQTLSGPARAGGAWSSFAGALCGLGIFAACLGWGLASPFAAFALAWGASALPLLGWAVLRGR